MTAGLIAHERGSWIDPSTGGAIAQRDVLARAALADAVLLGETHNIAEIHRWQLHVAAFLHVLRPDMAIGFEMFPRRLQGVLDRWVAGELSTAAFIERSEWYEVWGFEPSLYLPLFHFCRQQRVPMLALNCHRPLVTRVGKDGWDAIPVEERDGLTPSKPATDAYRRYLCGIVGGGPDARWSGPDDPAMDRFVRAQQCWDRAFACNIAKALDRPSPPLVIGIIGRGHLEYGHGTPYQLRDLGVAEVSVLLPIEAVEHDPARLTGIADAVFRLDAPEPPSAFRAKGNRPAAAPAPVA